VKSEEKTLRKLRDFHGLSEEMEALMQNYFDESGRYVPHSGRGFLPPMDCFETETEIGCLIELAGVAPQDLEVNLEGCRLMISGVRKEIPGFARRRYYKMELDFGFFERTFTIPEPVDPDSLRIENLGGFYLIRIKKKKPGLQPDDIFFDPASPDPRR